MWARYLALLVAVAATAFLAACGSDSGEPKRTLDARAEAIRFFEPDTPFVALADPFPGDSGDAAETLSSLTDVDAVTAFANNDLRFISQQGIPTGDLASLLNASDPSLETEDSLIAVGVTPNATPSEDALVVVVTAKPGAAADAVAAAAKTAGMSPAGTHDEADIFAGEHAAMAERDGVILIARTAERLREAITTRDADPDQHLDDSHVTDVLGEAPDDAPLVAYLDVASLAETDPGVRALTTGTGVNWLEDIGTPRWQWSRATRPRSRSVQRERRREGRHSPRGGAGRQRPDPEGDGRSIGWGVRTDERFP